MLSYCHIFIHAQHFLNADPFGECQDSYFIGFLNNKDVSQNRQVFLLSGRKEAPVDLSLPQYIRELTLVPQSVTGVSITPDREIVTQFGAYSSDRSVILAYNAESGSADACSSFPIQANYRGIEEYRAVSFRRSYNLDSTFNSTILIIGSEDDTKVDITATQNSVGRLNSKDEYTHISKGEMSSITIDKYESITISSVMDLTGTAIKASHPVAVYSGHECANVPSYSSSCDHLVEQIPPVNVLGTCYVAAAFAGRESGDYVRVVAVNPETYIKVRCTESGEVQYSQEVGPYSDGEFFEFFIAMDWHCTFETNKPAMVVQFSGTDLGESYSSDPFMVVLSDVKKLMNEIPFYSIDYGEENYNHYVNVVVPKEFYDNTAILLDDDPLSSYEHLIEGVKFDKCGNFVVIRLAVSPGYHFLHHSSPEAELGLTVYGFAADTSYGYSPGFKQGEIIHNSKDTQNTVYWVCLLNQVLAITAHGKL